jgi:hypothetical protein
MSNSPPAEYIAVRHILASPTIAARTAKHITDDDFDWSGLLHEVETMSSGEELLVRIASSLWSAEDTVGMWEVARKLDQRNFTRVLDALALCRGSENARAALREAA